MRPRWNSSERFYISTNAIDDKFWLVHSSAKNIVKSSRRLTKQIHSDDKKRRFALLLVAGDLRRSARDKMKRIMKPFGIAFATSGALGIAGFFGSALVPEEHHGCMMISIAVILWMVCMAVAATRQPVATQISMAAGVSWGFLFMVSVAISVNNGRVSVNWPTMLPGLVAIPAVIQLTATPVYLVSKLIHKKRTAEQSLGGDSENRAEDGTVPGAPQG